MIFIICRYAKLLCTAKVSILALVDRSFCLMKNSISSKNHQNFLWKLQMVTYLQRLSFVKFHRSILFLQHAFWRFVYQHLEQLWKLKVQIRQLFYGEASFLKVVLMKWTSVIKGILPRTLSRTRSFRKNVMKVNIWQEFKCFCLVIFLAKRDILKWNFLLVSTVFNCIFRENLARLL